MGELRKDYILDRFVIIASDRAKRPHEFKKKKTVKKEKRCFFCPGNEDSTPPEIYRYPKDKWQIRVFPNKFPAVVSMGKNKLTTDNNFFTYADSYGAHEVIVETVDHDKNVSDLTVDEFSRVLQIYRQRIEHHIAIPTTMYVSVFKNKGEDAGTSIIHSHSQLIAYNIVPEIIDLKEKAVEQYDSCPYCDIMKTETNSHRRCFETNSFVSFAPYASRFPFEVWIFPKRHILNITEFRDEEFIELAKIMNKILVKLKELNSDYNYYLQYGIKNMHFHIEVCPRLTKWAGFELATQTIINPISPESAAKFYRT